MVGREKWKRHDFNKCMGLGLICAHIVKLKFLTIMCSRFTLEMQITNHPSSSYYNFYGLGGVDVTVNEHSKFEAGKRRAVQSHGLFSF